MTTEETEKTFHLKPNLSGCTELLSNNTHKCGLNLMWEYLFSPGQLKTDVMSPYEHVHNKQVICFMLCSSLSQGVFEYICRTSSKVFQTNRIHATQMTKILHDKGEIYQRNVNTDVVHMCVELNGMTHVPGDTLNTGYCRMRLTLRLCVYRSL